MLGVDHVADGDLGEFHAWLRGAVRGRSRNAVGEGVHEDDEIVRIVDYAFGADSGLELLGGAIEPGGEKNGVRRVGVEMAESAVGDTAVVEDFAAFEFEVAESSEFQFLG